MKRQYLLVKGSFYNRIVFFLIIAIIAKYLATTSGKEIIIIQEENDFTIKFCRYVMNLKYIFRQKNCTSTNIFLFIYFRTIFYDVYFFMNSFLALGKM